MTTYPYQNEQNDADGGIFVPVELSDEVWTLIHNQAAVASLCRHQPMKRKTFRYRGFDTGPTAYWTDAGAVKEKSKATFKSLDLTAEKMAVIIPFEDELLEDMDTDLAGLISDDVVQAIAERIDETFLGYDATCPATIDELVPGIIANAPTHVIAYGTEVDLAGDISLAMNCVEVDLNQDVTGFIANPRIKHTLRNLRDADNRPLYQEVRSGGNQDTLHGLPIKYTTKVPFDDSSPATTSMIVGRWNYAIQGDRAGLSISKSNQATLTINGETINLWEQDLTAVRFVIRKAFKVRDFTAFALVTGIA